MKPNPEQDADRAAFEKWREQDIALTREEYPWRRDYYVWQAAKADSRAMQDAFEQVCEALEFYIEHDSYNHDMPREALSLAAPFRKTGG